MGLARHLSSSTRLCSGEIKVRNVNWNEPAHGAEALLKHLWVVLDTSASGHIALSDRRAPEAGAPWVHDAVIIEHLGNERWLKVDSDNIKRV